MAELEGGLLTAYRRALREPSEPIDDLVEVEPIRADEFTCSRCFLVHHRSRLADPGRQICRDCD